LKIGKIITRDDAAEWVSQTRQLSAILDFCLFNRDNVHTKGTQSSGLKFLGKNFTENVRDVKFLTHCRGIKFNVLGVISFITVP